MSLSDNTLSPPIEEQFPPEGSVSVEANPSEEQNPAEEPSVEAKTSMEEYYALQQELFGTTLILTGIIFVSVWGFYDLTTALSYLLGACVGVVYLRMLARSVERINTEQQNRGGGSRLALFVGLIIVALRWDQILFIPAFLGFLTYKAAVIIYTIRITLGSTQV